MPQRWVSLKRIGQGVLAAFIFLLVISTASAAAPHVISLSIQGPIGPATADYITRGIETHQKANLILITLDTPGGLDKSMRQIVQSILTSTAPVAVYVAPSGARAASAGTYILYAATVAAMAPATNLGAASPVNLDDVLGNSAENPSKKNMAKKVAHDSLAYIQSLAELRGRNLGFAKDAVRKAATLTASQALKAGVINVMATSTQDLLTKLNGIQVVQNNEPMQLSTKHATLVTVRPDWRMQFLAVVTDPTIAYLLLLIGIYGLFFEFFNPGFVAPGVIGGIALITALYAFQLLPISYAGLALILLGLAFMISEAYMPSFGVLGLGGTVSFLIGSLLLIQTSDKGYHIAISAIVATAAANMLIFVVLFGMLYKARKKPVLQGITVLIGETGRTIGPVHGQGQAMVRGEIWQAIAQQPIGDGKPIRVLTVRGLTLTVEEIQGE